MVTKLTYVIFWSFRKSYQRKNISKCLAGSKKNGNVEWLRFWSIESHAGNLLRAEKLATQNSFKNKEFFSALLLERVEKENKERKRKPEEE